VSSAISARDIVDHRYLLSGPSLASEDVAVCAESEAAEELQLEGVDISGQTDVWNVKLFRWLDNKAFKALTERRTAGAAIMSADSVPRPCR
jgi:hypothetical protein